MTVVDKRLTVSRLTTLGQLDALRDEWRELEAACEGLTPFSTWEWSGTVAEFFCRRRPLLALTVRLDGRLIGLAPLAVAKPYGVRVLRLIGTGLGRMSMADYQDILMAGGFEDKVAAALCHDLDRLGDWDVLHLQELPSSSSTASRITACARRLGWQAVRRPASDVHPLPLNGTWDEYKMTLSRTTRNDTGRLARKLVAEYQASFTMVNGDDSAVQRGMEALFDLHTGRWTTSGRPGIFQGGIRRRFHQELARRTARRGMLVLFLLNAGDEPVAAKYGFVHGGTQYHYAGGHSVGPAWDRFRLGMVLDLEMIKQAFEEGMRCIDFMRGEGHYKDHYRTQTLLNEELLVFRNRRARAHYHLSQLLTAGMNRLRRKIGRERLSYIGVG